MPRVVWHTDSNDPTFDAISVESLQTIACEVSFSHLLSEVNEKGFRLHQLKWKYAVIGISSQHTRGDNNEALFLCSIHCDYSLIFSLSHLFAQCCSIVLGILQLLLVHLHTREVNFQLVLRRARYYHNLSFHNCTCAKHCHNLHVWKHEHTEITMCLEFRWLLPPAWWWNSSWTLVTVVARLVVQVVTSYSFFYIIYVNRWVMRKSWFATVSCHHRPLMMQSHGHPKKCNWSHP